MSDTKQIVLFETKDKCCGCGACMNICPKHAIEMIEDEYGFLYPRIDEDKCVKCGACRKACAYQRDESVNTPLETYIAANRDDSQIKESASGGIFAAIATKVLTEGGVVFGAALEKDRDYFVNHHILIDNIDDLQKLQGSKYVQSSNGFVYKQVKELLVDGKTVLYSGTPCQVAGLYGFLGKKYDNLITVDLVCHGTPNLKMFNDYLCVQKGKLKASEIQQYVFRDKKNGWGESGRIDYIDGNGNTRSKYSLARLDSFNSFFLDVLISRENCYSCKYAGSNRPGDITLGDFWGIEDVHPEVVSAKEFDLEAGVSCMIANTEKGISLCKEMDGYIKTHISTFDKAAKHNKQLNKPSTMSPKRQNVLEEYRNGGYEALEAFYRKKYFKHRIVYYAFSKLPRSTRNAIKKFKG